MIYKYTFHNIAHLLEKDQIRPLMRGADGRMISLGMGRMEGKGGCISLGKKKPPPIFRQLKVMRLIPFTQLAMHAVIQGMCTII